MNCKNCGNILFEKDTFCTKCGTPVDRTSTPVQQPTYQQPVNPEPVQQPTYQQPTMEQPQQPVNPQPMQQQPVNNYQQPMYNQPIAPKKKTNPIVFILAGIGLVVVLAIVIIVIVAKSSKDFVCTSDQGSITIYYTKNNIVGYAKTTGVIYDFDEQQEVAKQKGVDQYFEEFNESFHSAFPNAKCTKDGMEMPSPSQTTPTTPTPERTTTPTANNNTVSFSGRTYTIPDGWMADAGDDEILFVNNAGTLGITLVLDGPYSQNAFEQFKMQMSEIPGMLAQMGYTTLNSGSIKTVSGVEFITFEVSKNGGTGLFAICQDPIYPTYEYILLLENASGSVDYSMLSQAVTIMKSGKSTSTNFSFFTREVDLNEIGSREFKSALK